MGGDPSQNQIEKASSWRRTFQKINLISEKDIKIETIRVKATSTKEENWSSKEAQVNWRE